MSSVPHTEHSEYTEKDYAQTNGSQGNIPDTMDSQDALQRMRTAGSVNMSPELFEKLYLSPRNDVKGDLRKTFGNPTALALIGFLMSLTPLSCELMGWRGSGGSGSATIGPFYFFGGLLMTLSSIGEFLLGNTFPFIVFGSFGAFWLAFAATLQDGYYGAMSAYTPTTGPNAGVNAGLNNPGFAQSFAFFLLFMGLLSFVYLICSIRTNIVFFIIFFTLVFTFTCLAASFWYLAQAVELGLTTDSAAGFVTKATKLQTAGGGFAFVTCLAGWYIFLVLMLASVDFPIQLPLGDLSTIIKGASEKAKNKKIGSE